MNWFRMAIAVVLLAVVSQARAEKRVALVIGNGAYRHAAQLANPSNDAADMTAKLKGLGFEVVTGEDLDMTAMLRTVHDFTRKVDGSDVALFFYSGHGLQVNGNNYMAPVDAQLSSYNDLDFETVPIDLVLSAMERSSKVNLVLLDACRDNPLAETLARSMGSRSGFVSRGLAKLGSGVGTLIAFATQPGNVAFDGGGRNSPFTTALLKHLGTPGQDITRDLVYVRRDVLDATDGKQVPWENSSLTGEVILNPLVVEPKAQSAVGPLSVAPADAVELAYWQTIKDATDKSYFAAYLQRYPDGVFAALATLKIDGIDKRAGEERQAKQKAEADAKAVAIAGLEPPVTEQADGLPADTAGSGTMALATQRELARIGCLAGEADGKWGSGSRQALKSYADRKGMKLASTEPTRGLLDGLKAIQDRICPLVCDSGMEVRDGRCQATPEPNLSAFDGIWKINRRATNSACGWRELSTNLLVNDGKISTDQWEGTVAKDGSVKIVHRFVYQGKNEQNILKGKIKGDKGTGKFFHVGGMCAGVIDIDRM